MSTVHVRRRRELVLVGGGHTHVQVLRRLAMEPVPATRVTVVVDVPVAVYSGMVPGFVAGQYRAEELEIDVVPLARRAGASVVLAPALGVDPRAQRIHVEGRPALAYDMASFDVGSTVAGLDLPGVREHALPTRPIARFVRRVEQLAPAAAGGRTRVVVVGGGAGGVELAFTTAARLRAAGGEPRVTIVHGGDRLLDGYPDRLSTRVTRAAHERGIDVLCGRRVVAVDAARVELDDGTRLAHDVLPWVTGAVSHGLFAASGLATDARGFVWTRTTLQVEGHDTLFAVGDCATLRAFPETAKAGVYAVRQGPLLSDNLARALTGRALRRYRPQSDFLTLLNLGDGTAVGTKWGRSFEGRWVMRLKDWLDRRFMRRFQVLGPDGRLTEPFASAPMGGGDGGCGGCAAKASRDVVEQALRRLAPAAARDDVVLGLDRADDAAAWRTERGDLVVGSVDAFRPFADDPYLVGRVAAVNAASDLFATGAAPRWAQAIVSLPSELDRDGQEELLFQLLSGAQAACAEIGIALLGGHTTTGGELLIGFSVAGVAADERSLLRLDGLRPGQRLVLTKPLGTGVVLRADAAGRARGAWVEAAHAAMARPNANAARAAIRCGASAMTDVTGFGLAGHLATMLRASACSARIDVAALPALPGAVELLALGVRSTAHPADAGVRGASRLEPGAQRDPRSDLPFDPQTSGGLLFGVDADRADEARERLRAGGDEAAVIGEVAPVGDDGVLLEIGIGPAREEVVASGPASPSCPTR